MRPFFNSKVSVLAITALVFTFNLFCANSDAQDSIPIAEVESLFGNPKFRITASYGWSGRINQASSSGSSQQKEFDEGLRTGQAIRLSFHHQPEGNFGIGLKFSHFFTSNSAEFTLIDNSNGNQITDNVSEEIGVSYIGLSGYHTEVIGSRLNLIVGLCSAAWISYCW